MVEHDRVVIALAQLMGEDKATAEFMLQYGVFIDFNQYTAKVVDEHFLEVYKDNELLHRVDLYGEEIL